MEAIKLELKLLFLVAFIPVLSAQQINDEQGTFHTTIPGEKKIRISTGKFKMLSSPEGYYKLSFGTDEFNYSYIFKSPTEVLQGQFNYLSPDIVERYKGYISKRVYFSLEENKNKLLTYKFESLNSNNKEKRRNKVIKKNVIFKGMIPIYFRSHLLDKPTEEEFSISMFFEELRMVLDINVKKLEVENDKFKNKFENLDYIPPEKFIEILGQESTLHIYKMNLKGHLFLLYHHSFYVVFEASKRKRFIALFGGNPKNPIYQFIEYDKP